MEELTQRQRQVLDAILDFASNRGYPPSIRELGKIVGIGSLRGVTIHLDALERKGWIERERTSRSIRIIAPSPMQLPLLGTIAAAKSDQLFTIKMSGDDMIGEHVVDGDTLVIKRGDNAKQGQLVACLIDGEVAVRRMGEHGTNDVVGKIIALVRDYA